MHSADRPRPVRPAAVSVLSADLLVGEPVAATVLGVHAPALYLDVAGRVLPVVTPDAVPLPTALRLTSAGGAMAWGVSAGDVVTVGGGRVVLPGQDLVSARTWRPARVRRVPASARPIPPALTHGEGARSGEDREWLVDGIRTLFPRHECASGRSDDRFRTHGEEGAVTSGVAALVGRGQGLTPSGDDALAGALLVAHALGRSAPLAHAVRARLHATTAVSAALLDAAVDGFAARDVVALVDAALAGDDAGVGALLPRVLALGHTSGRDLVTGVRAALDTLTTGRECGSGCQDDHFRTHREKKPTTGRSAA